MQLLALVRIAELDLDIASLHVKNVIEIVELCANAQPLTLLFSLCLLRRNAWKDKLIVACWSRSLEEQIA